MKYEKPASQRTSGHRGSADDPLGVNSEIGRKLKQYYDDLVSEEIPDKFAMLLTQLEASERSQQGEDKD
ncbi:NepR family anti-sigma factor [Nitratireductor indicus]|uniref:Anti-sigma factor NepR domain-containing protein n=1 Tax=Nitratireductor indicus C115 TaxID=1231190 RepID=K2N3J5_9HYPH|nr:NepR family anti-sigma factor [Nitratireductor indicus]EKF41968.1 hypothetical protein NA8A_12885 [Nitratireductor indicus C115]MDS1136623.1 NepR family anti-sigma factor [Nitratireductor indicus]SFQ47652.1 hypothetical protein SAMN05216176_104150 [Nitratireductor indicus]